MLLGVSEAQWIRDNWDYAGGILLAADVVLFLVVKNIYDEIRGIKRDLQKGIRPPPE